MQLEEYLDFQGKNDIRLAGTRIGVETILLAYLDDKLTAEEIAATFPALSLEQIYATILYYLHYREQMDAYLVAFTSESRNRQEIQDTNPSPLVRRLQHIARNGPSSQAG